MRVLVRSRESEGENMARNALRDRTGESEADTTRHDPPDNRGRGGGGPLERVTVNLIGRASRALQRVVDLTGDSKTDALNRAIQVYAYLEEIESNGGDIYIRESKDAELQLVKMF
jgi:hypothetical protein